MMSISRPIITAMRRAYLRWALIFVLGAMLGGHVTELFDHWDHTAQTGRDVDYTVVAVAACLGVVFAISKKLVFAALRLFATFRPPATIGQMASAFRMTSLDPLATGPPVSSLSPLRI